MLQNCGAFVAAAERIVLDRGRYLHLVSTAGLEKDTVLDCWGKCSSLSVYRLTRTFSLELLQLIGERLADGSFGAAVCWLECDDLGQLYEISAAERALWAPPAAAVGGERGGRAIQMRGVRGGGGRRRMRMRGMRRRKNVRKQ